jgi:hypothetical protein
MLSQKVDDRYQGQYSRKEQAAFFNETARKNAQKKFLLSFLIDGATSKQANKLINFLPGSLPPGSLGIERNEICPSESRL